MMYHKAKLFQDNEMMEKVMGTQDVKKQKSYGRKVKNFDEKTWDLHKYDVILKGNLLKFLQNSKIKKELIDSSEKTLVEASPYDKIYGVGLKWDNDLILDEKNWKGENLLGKALMETRDLIKNQKYNKILDEDPISLKEKKKKNFIAATSGSNKNQSIKYDKLIRDNIPEIIKSNNKICDIVNENDKNVLLKYYVKKLNEELKEVNGAKNKTELIEELADLSQVLDDLLEQFNIKTDFQKVKEKKKNDRGSFSNIILKKVSEKSSELEKAIQRTDSLPDNWFEGKPLLMEIKGSILDASEDIIAQGCNCTGASGAGIAKYIAQEYPESDSKYKALCQKKEFKLGSVMFNKEKDKIQAFCGTQIYYGKYLKMDQKSVEERYQAIEECLVKIYNKAKAEGLSVALPRIGCGRARADWSRVKKIIKKVFHDHPVTIYWIPDKYSKK